MSWRAVAFTASNAFGRNPARGGESDRFGLIDATSNWGRAAAAPPCAWGEPELGDSRIARRNDAIGMRRDMSGPPRDWTPRMVRRTCRRELVRLSSWLRFRLSVGASANIHARVSHLAERGTASLKHAHAAS